MARVWYSRTPPPRIAGAPVQAEPRPLRPVQTFSDEFNTLQLRNGYKRGLGRQILVGAEKGATLSSNGEQQWYINPSYEPTASVTPSPSTTAC
ncbi:hypothetical protein F2981_20675 (plasmid) [Sinorhizobium meliloti]|nr:hypothetical protein [Sinorhizobium meliloti]